MGKGVWRRPRSKDVTQEEIDKNWQRIFQGGGSGHSGGDKTASNGNKRTQQKGTQSPEKA